MQKTIITRTWTEGQALLEVYVEFIQVPAANFAQHYVFVYFDRNPKVLPVPPASRWEIVALSDVEKARSAYDTICAILDQVGDLPVSSLATIARELVRQIEPSWAA